MAAAGRKSSSVGIGHLRALAEQHVLPLKSADVERYVDALTVGSHRALHKGNQVINWAWEAAPSSRINLRDSTWSDIIAVAASSRHLACRRRYAEQ